MPKTDRDRPRLLAIVGPTAVGKTEVAVDLAQRFLGEIVSADSRQVYLEMNIGTAKPTYDERLRVVHHLIDFQDPGEALTLAEFQRKAYDVIADIHGRGKLPILVGGTGQYVQAILRGWIIPGVAPDASLRSELEAFAAIFGPSALYARLTALDPSVAERIDYRNVRRVVRALEVLIAGGQKKTQFQESAPPAFRVLVIGLTRPRRSLYARIDARIDEMIVAGLAGEVQKLVEAGHGWESPALSAVGYREFRPYLDGEIALDDVVKRIRRNTREFVRKQYNWFRLSDPKIAWFDLEMTPRSAIMAAVDAWMRGSS